LKEYSTVVGTLPYRAPEILVHYKYYDYAVDVWAAGVIMADLVMIKKNNL
jgi:casein kinase II subunit alpha